MPIICWYQVVQLPGICTLYFITETPYLCKMGGGGVIFVCHCRHSKTLTYEFEQHWYYDTIAPNLEINEIRFRHIDPDVKPIHGIEMVLIDQET